MQIEHSINRRAWSRKGSPAKPFSRAASFQMLLALRLLLFITAICGQAADLVWTNTSGGSWSVAANWSPNQLPGSSDHAFIINNGTYTVALASPVTILSFTLGGQSGTQTLTINHVLTITEASTVGTNGIFSSAPSNFSTLFAGQPISGYWQLDITDNAEGPSAVPVAGSLLQWSLDISAQTALPEPSSGLLLAVGLVGMALLRRR